MRKLYRVYYNTYSDEIHARVLEEVRRRFGVVVIDHPSRVVWGFRFFEVLLEDPGREDEIKDIVSSVSGDVRVKVDWVDTSR
ncbi:MAG: hypothetical protein P3X22_003805 [Thermoprotei archaeon]|nr:hypothetical protein [Thermoprotei archaeon]